MVALVLVLFAALWVISGLRFGEDLDLVFGVSSRSWPMAAGVAVGMAGLALRREIASGHAPWQSGERAATWLLVVIGPATLWVLADHWVLSGPDFIVILLMAGVGLATLVVRRSKLGSRQAWLGETRIAWRWLLGPTLIMGAALLAIGALASDHQIAGRDMLIALLTYPLFALIQLAIALVLPARLARSDGAHRVLIVIGCSALFVLIHAPNPLAMVLTGLGMILWSSAWLRGTGILWIALSMGVLGASVAEGLPDAWTSNMRVGPGYVLPLQLDRHMQAYDDRLQALASDEAFARSGGTLESWIEALHRDVFGEPAPHAVVDAWVRRIRNAHRDRIARAFLESAEFRRIHGIQRIFEGQDRSLLFSTFEAWHPAHGVYEQLRAPGLDAPIRTSFEDFLIGVYAQTLGRRPSSDGIASWAKYPRATEREDLVRVFLKRAGIEDPAPWRHPAHWPDWPGS